jgi:CheY-like chemotaxis protein
LSVGVCVDDEHANIAVESRLMGRLGFATATAADGEAALAAGIRERPDVVLLDVNMPRLDGFEVCRRPKDNPQPA